MYGDILFPISELSLALFIPDTDFPASFGLKVCCVHAGPAPSFAGSSLSTTYLAGTLTMVNHARE